MRPPQRDRARDAATTPGEIWRRMLRGAGFGGAAPENSHTAGPSRITDPVAYRQGLSRRKDRRPYPDGIDAEELLRDNLSTPGPSTGDAQGCTTPDRKTSNGRDDTQAATMPPHLYSRVRDPYGGVPRREDLGDGVLGLLGQTVSRSREAFLGASGEGNAPDGFMDFRDLVLQMQCLHHVPPPVKETSVRRWVRRSKRYEEAPEHDGGTEESRRNGNIRDNDFD
ncbi:hypothetical protein AGDE_16677 [Angomonas deanei]|nr:hypothetical protein AGDE_16677 [Angomonas deanei]|eukprot:EPY16634.1 hypothetical protein AGDE_16677 [Angomonas deanei]